MSRRNPYIQLVIILIIIAILFPDIYTVAAADKMKGPPGRLIKNQLEIYGEGDNSFLNIYQKWISPVKGGNTCPMHPACSQYAKVAFRMLPWYEAYISSLERLLRCGNELNLYPSIKINDQIHWYDPLRFEFPKQGAIIDTTD